MPTRDVDLIIRARDQTQNTFRSINDALDRFNTSQQRTQEQSRGTDTALDRLTASFAELRGRLGSGDVGGQISEQLTRARTAFTRLSEANRDATGESIRYATEARQAGRATRDLQSEQQRLAAQLQIEERALRDLGLTQRQARQELRGLRQQYSDLSKQVRAAAAQQSRLENSTRRAIGSLSGQDSQLARAEEAYRGLRQEASRLGASLAQLGGTSRRAILQSFGEQRQRLAQTRQEYQQSSLAAQRLGRELSGVAEPSRRLVAAFDAARAATIRGRAAYHEQSRVLTEIRGVLRETGGDLATFSERQDRVAAALKRGSVSYREFADQSRRAAAAIRESAQAQGLVAANTTRAAVAADRAATSTSRLARANTTLSQAIRRASGDTRRALGFTQRLRGQVLSLVGAYVSFFGALRGFEGVIQTYQTVETATNRLNVALQGNRDLVEGSLGFLRRTARRLGIQFGILSGEYSKFAIATQNTNLEGEATRRIFTAVAEAARVNNLAQEQLRGTFVALTQIVSKGVVSMEEIRQQLGDRIPGAIQILADSLDITTGQLIKLIEQGQLSSDVLLDFAIELERRFGGALPRALESLNAQIGRFRNAAFEAFEVVGQGGAIQGIQDFFASLTEVFQSAQFLSFLENLGVAIQGLTGFVAVLVVNFDLVLIALAAFIGFRLAPFLGVLALGFVRMADGIRVAHGSLVATNAQIATTGRLSRFAALSVRGLAVSFRALLSSTGIGLAVAAIATALTAWATSTKDATEALIEHRKIVDTVRSAYDQAQGSVERFRNAVVDDLSGTSVRQRVEAVGEDVRALGTDFDVLYGRIARADIDNRFLEGTAVQVLLLIRSFRDGRTSILEFNQSLDDIAQADPSAEALVLQVQDLGRQLNTGRQRIAELSDVLIALEGNSEDAGLALRRLSGFSGEVVPFNEAERLEKFNAQLARIQKIAPQSAQALEDANLAGKLEAARVAALDLANGVADVNTVFEAFDRASSQLQVDQLFRGASGLAAITRLLRQTTSIPDSELTGRTVDFRARAIQTFGEAEFEAFSDRQQAVLTATVALFEDVPRQLRVAVERAIQEGSNEGIVEAFRDLQGRFDLRGASGLGSIAPQIFGGGSAPDQGVLLDAEIERREELLRLAQEEAEERAEAADASRRRLVDLGFEVEQQQRKNQGLDREVEIEAALRQAREENAGVSQEQLTLLRERVGQLFDLQQALDHQRDTEQQINAFLRQRIDTQDTLSDLAFRIDQQRLLNQGFEREARVSEAVRQARTQNLAITREEITLLRERVGLLFDLENQGSVQEEQEGRINELLQLRRELQTQISAVTETDGSVEVFNELQSRLASVNSELVMAAATFVALLETIEDLSPATEALLERMRGIVREAEDGGRRVIITWEEVFRLMAGTATSAISGFAEAIADGQNAVSALGDAFRQFASNFLRRIAEMILQQIIFNALQSAFPGLGGFLSFHSGGVAGQGGMRLPSTRRGLRGNEIGAVLERGEEVLTADDPRHVRNLGGSGSSGGTDVTVNNFVDSASFLEEGLRDRRGGEAISNWISANRQSVRSALGV